MIFSDDGYDKEIGCAANENKNYQNSFYKMKKVRKDVDDIYNDNDDITHNGSSTSSSTINNNNDNNKEVTI